VYSYCAPGSRTGHCGERFCPVVSIQYRLVTNGRTHDDSIHRASIASRGENEVTALCSVTLSMLVYRAACSSPYQSPAPSSDRHHLSCLEVRGILSQLLRAVLCTTIVHSGMMYLVSFRLIFCRPTIFVQGLVCIFVFLC